MPLQQKRLETYLILKSKFDCLSDQEILRLLDQSRQRNHSPWSQSFSLKFEDRSLFIKIIPVTHKEKENLYSTANLFDLPMYYHYGIGSAGFGVWRELQTYRMTTSWVLEGKCLNFPIMYHHRILLTSVQPNQNYQHNIERDVAYWDNNLQIRERLVEMNNAKESLAIILEFFPQTLSSSIHSTLSQKEIDLEDFAEGLLSQLSYVNNFMKKQKFVHFDAHFKNLLTDAKTIYFSDFGLSLSEDFDLSEEERHFLNMHLKSYDQACSIVNLLHVILSTFCKHLKEPISLRELLEKSKSLIPKSFTLFLNKYITAGLIMDDFFITLQKNSKSTPYPRDLLDKIVNDN